MTDELTPSEPTILSPEVQGQALPGDETVGGRAGARVPFTQAVRAAREAALRSLGRQRVPEAYERVVRDYFDRPAEPPAPTATDSPR